MNDKEKRTRQNDDEGNVFQINEEPASDIEQSDIQKPRKPQGNAFQINGGAEEEPESGRNGEK